MPVELDLHYLELYLKKMADSANELSAASSYASRSGCTTRRLERIISLVELEMRTIRWLQLRATGPDSV